MRRNSSPFKWRHYAHDVILLCVRWYCRYSLSYRDFEEMMRERGLTVDHVTVFRWVQRYAPEINKRMRPHLRMSGASYRLDETYVKVGSDAMLPLLPHRSGAGEVRREPVRDRRLTGVVERPLRGSKYFSQHNR